MRQATGLLLVVAMLLGGCAAYVAPGRAGISIGAPVAGGAGPLRVGLAPGLAGGGRVAGAT